MSKPIYSNAEVRWLTRAIDRLENMALTSAQNSTQRNDARSDANQLRNAMAVIPAETPATPTTGNGET